MPALPRAAEGTLEFPLPTSSGSVYSPFQFTGFYIFYYVVVVRDPDSPFSFLAKAGLGEQLNSRALPPLCHPLKYKSPPVSPRNWKLVPFLFGLEFFVTWFFPPVTGFFSEGKLKSSVWSCSPFRVQTRRNKPSLPGLFCKPQVFPTFRDEYHKAPSPFPGFNGPPHPSPSGRKNGRSVFPPHVPLATPKFSRGPGCTHRGFFPFFGQRVSFTTPTSFKKIPPFVNSRFYRPPHRGPLKARVSVGLSPSFLLWNAQLVILGTPFPGFC